MIMKKEVNTNNQSKEKGVDQNTLIQNKKNDLMILNSEQKKKIINDVDNSSIIDKEENPFYNDFFDEKYNLIYSDFVSKNETLKAKKTAASSSTITKRKIENKTDQNFPYDTLQCIYDYNTIEKGKSIPKPMQKTNGKQKKLDYSVSNRLYNYGFYVKNKIEKKRRKEYEKTAKKMIPKMNYQSSLLLNKVTRKPLYYKSTIDNSSSKIKLEQEQFSHKPTINNLSIKIASQLESSKSRLLRKSSHKKDKLNSSTSSLPNNFMLNDYYKNVKTGLLNKRKCVKISKSTDQIDQNKDKNNCSCDSKGVPKRVFELYSHGVEQYKKKEEKYKENLLKSSLEYKKYPFKPKSSKNSKMIMKYLINGKTNPNSGDFYEQQVKWKENVERKTQRYSKELFQEDFEDCTFRPSITPLNVNTSISSSMKNLYSSSGFDYIIRRRKMLEEQNKDNNDIHNKGNPPLKNGNYPKNKKGKSGPNSGNNSFCMTRKSEPELSSKEQSKNKVYQLQQMRKMLNTNQFFYEQFYENDDMSRLNYNRSNYNDKEILNFEEMVGVIYSHNKQKI